MDFYIGDAISWLEEGRSVEIKIVDIVMIERKKHYVVQDTDPRFIGEYIYDGDQLRKLSEREQSDLWEKRYSNEVAKCKFQLSQMISFFKDGISCLGMVIKRGVAADGITYTIKDTDGNRVILKESDIVPVTRKSYFPIGVFKTMEIREEETTILGEGDEADFISYDGNAKLYYGDRELISVVPIGVHPFNTYKCGFLDGTYQTLRDDQLSITPRQNKQLKHN